MTMSSLIYQASKYKVNTSVYEGPLDLLLQLIERAELDITTLALAQVTDQYLEYLHNLEEQIPAEVSAFLVIAARLVQIKSNALLPRPPAYDDLEEDPGEALANQLRIYKRYKDIAEILNGRGDTNSHTYLRLTATHQLSSWIDLSDVSLKQFIDAAIIAFNKEDEKITLGSVVSMPKVTIREKISLIQALLRRQKTATFNNLIKKTHTRIDVVVTFLAVLELTKRHLLRVSQIGLFGEITLEPEGSWDENDSDINGEFGE